MSNCQAASDNKNQKQSGGGQFPEHGAPWPEQNQRQNRQQNPARQAQRAFQPAFKQSNKGIQAEQGKHGNRNYNRPFRQFQRYPVPYQVGV